MLSRVVVLAAKTEEPEMLKGVWKFEMPTEQLYEGPRMLLVPMVLR